ncbi:Iron(III) dicitrate-binding protein [Pseudomonas sp. M47T1]|uniref:ABC transporter substrate-binding protein n=1 Tax=Pseudomonas sp. M47T1 TaxID=1179778 RepID=UPI00026085FD|nr:ABC transporter substrate-binding protein [Pseudomonas sp. M47T1]EIK95397.1 Iron(III) dicitrate-binding protein [Pseudomonas sp. M47T1]
MRLAVLALALCSSVALAVPVTDDSGQWVDPPAHPQRIADGWFAHHALMMTLGAGGNIVATVNHADRQPWMFKVQPSLNQAQTVNGTAFNVETLLADKVDLVFTSTGDRQALAYQQAGIAVVRMGFNDLPGLEHSLTVTALALNTDIARQRAHDYNAWLDSQVTDLHRRTADLADAQRPRVLHIASLNPLRVDGADTLINTWINLAGGRNAATGLKGNLQAVDAEQVLAWHPDVVILAADAGDLKQVPLLWQLQGVKVLRNPAGVFPWDRYGTEVGLQLLWAGQQLHPQRFKDVDMVQQTMGFYRRFFDYPLSVQQAGQILAGQHPDA